MAAVDIETELNEAHGKLREVNTSIDQMMGRPARSEPFHQPDGRPLSTNLTARLSTGNVVRPRIEISADGDGERRVYNGAAGGGGFSRKRISLNDRFAHPDDGDGVQMGAYGKRVRRSATHAYTPAYINADHERMMQHGGDARAPMIETKTREERMKERAAADKGGDVKTRNRRMFANMLGSLSGAKRATPAVNTAEQKQAKKQAEIEQRLEDDKKKSKQQLQQDRRELMHKRQEELQHIQHLQRKKICAQIADREMNRMAVYSSFIQTKGAPSIFYCPGKHTLRTLELQKNTKRTWDDKIATRRAQMESDLASMDVQANGRRDGPAAGNRTDVAPRRRRDSRSRSPVDGEEAPKVAKPTLVAPVDELDNETLEDTIVDGDDGVDGEAGEGMKRENGDDDQADAGSTGEDLNEGEEETNEKE